jgi:hypothetical protein
VALAEIHIYHPNNAAVVNPAMHAVLSEVISEIAASEVTMPGGGASGFSLPP